VADGNNSSVSGRPKLMIAMNNAAVLLKLTIVPQANQQQELLAMQMRVDFQDSPAACSWYYKAIIVWVKVYLNVNKDKLLFRARCNIIYCLQDDCNLLVWENVNRRGNEPVKPTYNSARQSASSHGGTQDGHVAVALCESMRFRCRKSINEQTKIIAMETAG
jgi:hypothetical protein